MIDLFLTLAIWRVIWYTVLVYHSIKYRAYRDAFLGFFLLSLAFIINRHTKPFVAIAGFLVAPLISVSIMGYQKKCSGRF